MPREKDLLQEVRWEVLKAEVLEERGERCEICGSDENLEIHHIKKVADYPELRWDKNNCKVLCHKCHIKIHKKRGDSVENEK